ncbi:LuxR C-terminal-related transcriptional regulator [Tenacibaculum piscium]|uniref:LuxR C-terminal-related transcriptional regulator n=1 Tax=Tenacibaculum piscium TaxID=1458515 RepID=UPI00293F13D9|nr:LuxR C-terminal-related transcriptional regulator [Tenacibaculum piscium]
MLKQLFVFFISISFFSISAQLQNTSQDKYQNLKDKTTTDFFKLKTKPDTKEKVDALLLLFKKSAIKKYVDYSIAEEAIKTARKIYYVDGIAKGYSRIGVTARYQQEYYKSIENHKNALNYFQKSTDTLAKVKCLNSLGVTYRKINLEKQAFKYYFEAYGLADKIKSDRSKSIALNGIGNVFSNINEHQKALYYFKEALKIEEKNNNERGIEYGLANIGESFIYLKSYDSAYVYLEKAILLSTKNKRKDSKAIKLNLLGLLYQKKKEYKKANSYYNQAKNIFEKTKNIRYLSNTKINIGINNCYLNKRKIALSFIESGLNDAIKIDSKENILLGYNALSNFYIKSEKYKKALEINRKATALKDTMLNEASQKSIISSQVAYETYEKDKKIKQLDSDNQKNQQKAKNNFNKLLYGGILVAIIFIGATILFILDRKNTDLKLQNANKDIQNYVLQLNELKNNVSNAKRVSVEDRISLLDLTKREAEVLQLIVKGYQNTDISKELFISANTVKTHIKNIYVKLDVKNRVQVIKKVVV